MKNHFSRHLETYLTVISVSFGYSLLLFRANTQVCTYAGILTISLIMIVFELAYFEASEAAQYWSDAYDELAGVGGEE